MRNTHYTHLLLLTLLPGLWSCTSTGDEPSGAANEVRFTASTTESRAAVGSDKLTEAGSKFKVWGNYRTSGKPDSPVSVFDGTEVTSNGTSWGYTDTQYWFPGHDYTFRAFYPADCEGLSFVTGNTTETDHLVLADFDARSGNDILAATHTRHSPAEGNGTVALAFRHLLARINFRASIDNALIESGTGITINYVKLSGIPHTAVWNSTGLNDAGHLGGWDFGETPAADDYPTHNVNKPLTSTPQVLLDGEFATFVIPQNIPMTARIDISYTDNNGTTHTPSANLYRVSQAIGKFEGSRVYTYDFVIGPQEYILFSTPTVADWTDAGGGNYIIQ